MVDELLAELQHPDAQRRHQALRRLRVVGGSHAVAALIQSLDDPCEGHRVHAALLLGEMEVPEVIPALTEHLNSDAPGIERAIYAQALWTTHRPEAVQPLIDALNDPDERVVKEACSGLMVLEDPRAIQPLMRTLDHPSWSVRYEACSALMELGVTDARVITALEKLTQDPDAAQPYLRRMEQELARLKGAPDGESPQDSEAEKEREYRNAMVELQDTDSKVQARAIDRLQRLGTSRAVNVLMGALSHPDAGTRGQAVVALCEMKAAEALPALLERLLHDEAPHVRMRCVMFLDRFQDERIVEPFILALADSDPQVLWWTSLNLGCLGDTRAVPALLHLLDHTDWIVRYHAAKALLKLQVADTRLVAALERLAQEPEAEEHDLEVDEWNCNLERHRRLAREIGDPEPEPRPKLAEMLEQARQFAE